jgi:hypothetical protein
MHRLAFLIFTVLACDVSLSQQPRIPDSNRFKAIEEFVSDEEAVRIEKLKFVLIADPYKRYTLDQHQVLWNNNILFTLPFKHTNSQPKPDEVNSQLKIDAFGLSSTMLVYKKHPQLSDKLMKKINGQFVGKSIGNDELYELVQDLKKELDAAWRRSPDKNFDSLILRAELSNHHSRVTNKPECWLLVEVSHAKRDSYDLFICDFVDKQFKLEEKRRARFSIDVESRPVRTALHPEFVENQFVSKNRSLEKNQNEATIIVHDDKLTIAEREAIFGFQLVDNTDRKFHQIESCTWPNVDNSRVLNVLSEASSLISDRVPKGSFLSFEELHLRIGSAANVFQRRFPNYQLIVTVDELKIGKSNYSRLTMNVALKQ